MRNTLALLILACGSLHAQDIFTVPFKVTLAATTTALTVQLPATGAHQTEILEATAQCSAACSIRLERNGNAAVANGGTILAVTPVALNPETTPDALETTPNIAAFSGSGIPTGTAVTPIWILPAGAILPFGGGRILAGTGGAINYTMRIAASYTGDVTLFFSLRVRR